VANPFLEQNFTYPAKISDDLLILIYFIYPAENSDDLFNHLFISIHSNG